MKIIGKQIVVELPTKVNGYSSHEKWMQGFNDAISEVAKMNPAWESGGLEPIVQELKALLIAVTFKTPPVNYGTEEDQNLCYEARVPIRFVHDAEKALANFALAKPDSHFVMKDVDEEELSKLIQEKGKKWETFDDPIVPLYHYLAQALASNPSAWMKRKDSDENN